MTKVNMGTIQGFLNPVRAAQEWLELQGNSIDLVSFDRVAGLTEELQPGQEGFLIEGLEDLNKLCEIGGFMLYFGADGVVHTRHHSEGEG